MIKAIIWDMDGVLVDSEHHHTKVEIETLKLFGVELTPEIRSKFVGNNKREYFKGLSEYFQKDLPIDEVNRENMKRIEKIFWGEVELMENLKEVLWKLHKNYLQAIATGSPKILAEILTKKFNLEDIFKLIVSGDEVLHAKPDPEIFLTAAQKLGTRPEETVVIEDSPNGFKAAKAAGMLLIAYKAHHNQNHDFSLADYVVTNLSEIPTILERINKTSS